MHPIEMFTFLPHRQFPFLMGLFIFVGTSVAHAQNGCTDSMAINYDTAAVVNDGSCLYPATTFTPLQKAILPASPESSGLVWTDAQLWTHDDSGGPNAFFQIDSANGNLLKTVTLTNTSNQDWEDLAADQNYFYIADIGNNSGTRTNLRIFRVAKNDIDTGVHVHVLAD